MTFSFPLAIMYSALISSSLRVLASPLLRRIGLFVFPSSLSKSKFCIFLAPTCKTSTSSKSGRSVMLIISVTIGSPVAFLASCKSSIPLPFRPWKSYGEVLGLKAPPLSIFAPASLTAFATATICSSLSTEQGPAIMQKCPPPIFTPLTSITVSSGWNLRLQHLNDSDTLVTDSTISRLSIKSLSTFEVSPISPRTVLYSPSEIWTPIPIPLSQSMSWFLFSSLTFLFNATTMILSS